MSFIGQHSKRRYRNHADPNDARSKNSCSGGAITIPRYIFLFIGVVFFRSQDKPKSEFKAQCGVVGGWPVLIHKILFVLRIGHGEIASEGGCKLHELRKIKCNSYGKHGSEIEGLIGIPHILQILVVKLKITVIN